jgi:hypothetical protein
MLASTSVNQNRRAKLVSSSLPLLEALQFDIAGPTVQQARFRQRLSGLHVRVVGELVINHGAG